jgi:cytoskeletal protein CcmA (bactofilin family)
MWKKEEGQDAPPTADSASRQAAPRMTSGNGRATIGPSISIRGDVTGSEDLLIQGRIDGSVDLGSHSVAVGSEGRVNANISGRVITIEGHVEGDLAAQEQIVLRGTARVLGDIKAPRVVLEDGATFRGLVDMGALSAQNEKGKAPSDAAESGSAAERSKGGAAQSDDKSDAGVNGKTDAKVGAKADVRSDSKAGKVSATATSNPTNGSSTPSAGSTSGKEKDAPGTAGQARA